MHEIDVRKASERFYEALNRTLGGDAQPMQDVWSHGPDVTQMGPFGGLRTGWEEVRSEFEEVAKVSESGHVEAKGLIVRVEGNMAYTLCTEEGETEVRGGKKAAFNQRATSIYRRDESGRWLLAHHHTDVAPRLQELMREATRAGAGVRA